VIAEPRELVLLILEQYHKEQLGEPGRPAQPSPLARLDAQLSSIAERTAARKGIEDFVKFFRKSLLENRPQTHVMFAQDFGVQLADGQQVRIAPLADELQEGVLEPTLIHPVTEGRSIRGQHGVQPSEYFGITGTQEEPYRR